MKKEVKKNKSKVSNKSSTKKENVKKVEVNENTNLENNVVENNVVENKKERIKKERIKKEIIKEVKPKIEISEDDTYTSNPPDELLAIYTILSRMYDTTFDNKIVMYNLTKKCIIVDLTDTKLLEYHSINDEINKIRVVSGYSSLTYNTYTENGKNIIIISI